mmetsp:Transcript_39520/g.72385  ORF Transcript_39520/g.72385 Transcript_39520/m.72385 type:complete len:428 (-) Transcript_39520:162-1445(-)
MTAFTVPIDIDRIVLVIPNPGTNDSIGEQVAKVIEPFTVGVWIMVIVIVTLTGLLSVWFSEEGYKRRLGQAKRPNRRTKRFYSRLALDEFLQKGTFFCSAGVEQDAGASLPYKLLMFGFAFFILIVVSSYVANLAAFLTRSKNDYVGTMEAVVASGQRICAVSALKVELEVRWEKASFIFDQPDLHLLDLYDSGKCSVLALGEFDMGTNFDLVDKLCERDLVSTNSILVENAIAFPVNPDLASALSYWIHNGEKYNGISHQHSLDNYYSVHQRQPSCDVKFSAHEHENSEFAQIGVQHLFLPIMFFLGFAVLAIVLQLFYWWELRSGTPRPLVGRASSLGVQGQMNKDSEDQLTPTTKVSANVTAKGPISSEDAVQLDNFHDNCIEQSAELSIGGDGATSRLQVLVETGALDEFFACFQDMKRRKQS